MKQQKMTAVLKQKQQQKIIPNSKQKSTVYKLQAIDEDDVVQKQCQVQSNFYYQDPFTNQKLAINKNILNLYPAQVKSVNSKYPPANGSVYHCQGNDNAKKKTNVHVPSHVDSIGNKNRRVQKEDRKNVQFRHSHREEGLGGDRTRESKKIIKQCYELLRSTRKFQISTLQIRNQKLPKSPKHNQPQQQHFSNLAKSKIQKCLKRRKQEQQGYSKQKQKLSKLLTCNSTHQNGYPESIQTTPSSPRKQEENSYQLIAVIKSMSKNKIEQRFSKRKGKKSVKLSKEGDQDRANRDCLDEDSYEDHNNPKFLKKLVRRGGGQKSFKNIPFSIGKSRKIILEMTPVERVIKETQEQLRNIIKKKGEYLIKPKAGNTVFLNSNFKNRQAEQLIGNEISGRYHLQRRSNPLQSIKKQQPKQTNKYFRKSLLDPFLFKQDTSRLHENSPRELEPEPLPEQTLVGYNKILLGIEQNNYHLVQIQLSLNPKILEIKQESNKNNLLHFCVMNNREEIFQMVLKKCRENGVDAVNQKNKYGRTPVELGNMLGFFRRRGLKDLLKKIDKEKISRAFNLISSLL